MLRWWILGIVALVALCGVLWLTLAGRSGKLLPTGRSGRAARLGRIGAGFAAGRIGGTLRRVFATGAARKRITDAQRKAEAERVANELGQMKGLLMKIGQLLAFIVGDSVSSEYREALSTLQTSAPPLEFALLRDVLERELGKPLERAFSRFDVEPLASASIGQVHRAQLPTGEEVVVKIQYPGVAEAIRGDVAQADLLYSMMGMAYPGIDVKGLLGEFRDRFFEELDYKHEADCQRAFAELYEGHPFIRVPKVIASHSTERVLTTELVTGRRFRDILTLDQAAKSRYGEILYRFFFGTIGRFGAFHCDPHPGNYIFDDEGRVIFLDFGCVKFLEDDTLVHWRALDVHGMGGDQNAFLKELVALRFVPANSTETALWFELFAGIYEPLKDDRPFTFTRAFFKDWLDRALKPKEPYASLVKKANRPAELLFAQRIQLGTYALLTELDATANWHRIHEEVMLGKAPYGELGEAEARWRRGRDLDGPDVRVRREGVRHTAHAEPAVTAPTSERKSAVG